MEDKTKKTISDDKTDKEKVVLDIVSENEFFYKFPNNINMVYTYPIMKIIKTILTSEKKYDKNIGKNIHDFFDYELNKENPIQKIAFIRIWDNIEVL